MEESYNSLEFWKKKFVWSCENGDLFLAKTIFYFQFPKEYLLNIYDNYNLLIERSLELSCKKFNKLNDKDTEHNKIIMWIYNEFEEMQCLDIYESIFSGLIEITCTNNNLELFKWLFFKNISFSINSCLFTSIENKSIDILDYILNSNKFIIKPELLVKYLHNLFYKMKPIDDKIVLIIFNKIDKFYIEIINSNTTYNYIESKIIEKFNISLELYNTIFEEFIILINRMIKINNDEYFLWFHKIGIIFNETIYKKIENIINKDHIIYQFYLEFKLKEIFRIQKLRKIQRRIHHVLWKPNSRLCKIKENEFNNLFIKNIE